MPDILICQMLVDAVVAFALLELAVLVGWHALTRRGLAAAELVANLSAGLCLLGALRSVLAGASWPVCALWLAAAGVAHATDLVRRLRAAAARARDERFSAAAPSPFPH
jgi:hypothetical protein